MSLKEFIEDLQAVEKYSEKLTTQGLFIAGLCACKSGTPCEAVLKYLAYTEKLFEQGLLTNTNKTIIEFHFYKGEVNEAKKLLKQYRQGQNELQDSVTEINSTVKAKEEPKQQEAKLIAKKEEKMRVEEKVIKVEPKLNKEEAQEIQIQMMDILMKKKPLD
jgi:ABC-type phosphate transport system auxiliary subunit